jgi:hypothetical protein
MASPIRRTTVVSIAIGIAIPVVVFGVVFPQVTSYRDAYSAVASCTPGWLMALLLASLLNVMLYPFPVLMSLRDLTYQRGFVVRQSGYLMSNLTPVGGALAVGTQFKEYGELRVGLLSGSLSRCICCIRSPIGSIDCFRCRISFLFCF